jgi:AcrR family transcriptional regulator
METRREQIYNTAGALFSRRGYAATSVRDIAGELDLQGGSLYAHIKSKEDVLWAIVSRAAEQFLAAARPLAASDTPAPARLRGMIRAHIAVVTGRIEQATVFLQDWKYLSSPRREQIGALRDEYEGLYRATIADGVARGEFAPTDPKLAATMVLSAINGVHAWYRPAGPLSPDEIAERFADMLLNGLKVEGRRSKVEDPTSGRGGADGD